MINIKSLIILSFVICTLSYRSAPGIVSKYQIRLFRTGQFKEYPKKGDTVRVEYKGMFPDGTVFDSTQERGIYFEFRLGVGHVIPCWEEMIPLLTIGDYISIICLSQYAYGDKGYGNVIPPGADLRFEILILGFGDYL